MFWLMMRYLVTVTRPEVCAKEPSQGQMGILIVNESSLWLVVGSAGQKTDRGVGLGYNIAMLQYSSE